MTTETHLSDVKFSDLDLLPVIRTAVEDAGFVHCTPIQAETLPLSLDGQDIAGQAQTGTGKTAAFALAAIQYLLNNPLDDHQKHQVRCLVLVPTRELALQVANDAKLFAKDSGLTVGIAYGGTGYESQKKALADGVDILIGTPGRLIDFWKQKLYSLKRTQALVLDEADRMFDLGFIKDIRFLLRRLSAPEDRLNMLFSATLSTRVLELAYEHMNNPKKVEIAADTKSADRVEQWVYYPSNDEKIPLLVGLIQKLEPLRCIVFVNTKRNAERIDAYLRTNNVNAVMISGDVRQNKRQRFLKEFEGGKHQVLIATDVAARGLHIDDVTHVVNFDLPQSEEDYVHRIGRTARAGASGEAHSFACEDTAFYLPEIEAYIGMTIPMATVTAELLPELEKPRKTRTRKPSGGKSSGSGRPDKSKRRRKPRNGSSGNEGQTQSSGQSTGDSSDKPGDAPVKKKRRRRRRKPKTDGPPTAGDA